MMHVKTAAHHPLVHLTSLPHWLLCPLGHLIFGPFHLLVASTSSDSKSAKWMKLPMSTAFLMMTTKAFCPTGRSSNVSKPPTLQISKTWAQHIKKTTHSPYPSSSNDESCAPPPTQAAHCCRANKKSATLHPSKHTPNQPIRPPSSSVQPHQILGISIPHCPVPTTSVEGLSPISEGYPQDEVVF